jgi:nucleoside-diphosphate-sugar epimerase
MTKAKRTALVTGASGLAGGYMLAHLLEQGGWDVIAVSRRKPRIGGDYRHVAVDLLDPADCQAKLGPLTNITHLFYLAITERADPGETISANANMFFNLVKTVEAASPMLEHVHLSQGTRWYGNHLGPYKTPTREDDPRHMPPNFYYDQQDFLEEFQKGKRWTWSVGRPHAVCGFSTGGPMNLTLAIAVYANICKALGLPLSFPGKPGAYTALYQCTDAALLAKAVGWMATDPKCANQAFNITNSDLIRWQNLWPKFANFFGMELAPPRPISLARSMADKGPIWEKIVEKNGLQKFRFEEIAAWGYPDGVFASDYDIVSDTSKARRFGFHDAELVTKDELFRRADVVTIHLILSERTRGLVGAAELALMKPTARLVNTSRGPIVDEQALIETLRTQAIAGAAVDVFDTEPLPATHPFRSLENVLATPHIGFVAEDLYRTFYGDAAAVIGAWIENQAPSP